MFKFPIREDNAVNSSSYFTSLALLAGLFHLLCEWDDDSPARSVFAALMFAGLAALKNVALPLAACLCLAAIGYSWRRGRPRVWRNAAIATAVTGTVMLIWYLPRIFTRVTLIPLAHGSGTDEVSLAYMFGWVASGTAWDQVYWGVFAAAACAAPVVAFRAPHRLFVTLVALAVVLGILAMEYGSGGIRITRYGQPLCLMGYLFCTTLVLAHCRRPVFALLLALPVAFGFSAFRRWGPLLPVDYFAGYADTVQRAARGLPLPNTERGWKAPYPTADQIQAVKRVQAAMVPGAAALVHANLPFLLDFSRNRIWVVDLPTTGPTAGIPWKGHGPELVQYLRASSINYIVYDYADEAGLSTAGTDSRLNDPRYPPWERKMIRSLVPFHEQLLLIGARWPKVYDDGHTMVVDIAAAPAAVSPAAN